MITSSLLRVNDIAKISQLICGYNLHLDGCELKVGDLVIVTNLRYMHEYQYFVQLLTNNSDNYRWWLTEKCLEFFAKEGEQASDFLSI